MFELEKAMRSLQTAGQAMQNYAEDAVVQEQYRAALEVYTRNMQMQAELAHIFLKKHQEVNARVFQEAIEYLDIAMEYANVELARSALKLIEVMQEKEPEFFREYYYKCSESEG